jgi:cobyrinic acid a,c-diamide synthase
MKRGTGMKDRKDGIIYNNVFACYTHLHALGTPSWAPNFVRKAAEFKKKQ